MAQWLGTLFSSVLAQVIAALVVGFIGGTAAIIVIRRRSRMKITRSTIQGDVVSGDKRSRSGVYNPSKLDKRDTSTLIRDSEVGGDVIQGDKEV